MKMKFAIVFVLLCCILNIFIFFITKNESSTINSMLVLAHTEEPDKKQTSVESTLDVSNVEEIQKVRVLISTSDYESIYHSEIKMANSSGMIVEYGDNAQKTSKIKADEMLVINEDSDYFESDVIIIHPDTADEESPTQITSITRNCGTPTYYGSFEIEKTSDGIILINIVPEEKYISSVVSSELNSSFHAEALKAQAVCARTYLYYIKEIKKYSEYNADIEDSKNCQVYNNNEISKTVQEAVAGTEGEIITYKGNVINAVYFSTSCGATTTGYIFNKDDMNYTQSVFVSNTESTLDLTDEADFQKFIDSNGESIFNLDVDNALLYDSEYPYYRWNVTLGLKEIQDAIKAGTSTDVGVISEITPTDRIEGGTLTSITVYGSEKTIVITGQDNIRKSLCKSGTTVSLNDGRTTNINSLPSAFFYLKAIYDNGNLSGYEFVGGGYGHGCGLSQNAAKTMAEQGMTYIEIINFFYNDIEIQKRGV